MPCLVLWYCSEALAEVALGPRVEPAIVSFVNGHVVKLSYVSTHRPGHLNLSQEAYFCSGEQAVKTEMHKTQCREKENECSALSQTSLSTALLKRDARVGYNMGF